MWDSQQRQERTAGNDTKGQPRETVKDSNESRERSQEGHEIQIGRSRKDRNDTKRQPRDMKEREGGGHERTKTTLNDSKEGQGRGDLKVTKDGNDAKGQSGRILNDSMERHERKAKRTLHIRQQVNKLPIKERSRKHLLLVSSAAVFVFCYWREVSRVGLECASVCVRHRSTSQLLAENPTATRMCT